MFAGIATGAAALGKGIASAIKKKKAKKKAEEARERAMKAGATNISAPGSDKVTWGEGHRVVDGAYFKDPSLDADPRAGMSDLERVREQALGSMEGGRFTPQADMGGYNAANMLGLNARNQSQGAVDLAQQAALGQAPSQAAIQQEQGLADAINAQMAMANSAVGGGAGQRMAMQRQAGQQGARMQQAGIGDAAALRAQEMATARDQYGTLTDQLRGRDMDLAQQAGDFGQADADRALKNRMVDDQRMQALLGSMQGFSAQDLEAQKASSDAKLRLMGIEEGADQFDKTRTDKYVGAGMEAGGEVLSMMPNVFG